MLALSRRCALCVSLIAASSQSQELHRPPATPLITHDPYFSVWSNTDELTASPTRHWTGAPQPLLGLVRIDGKAFRIMSRSPGSVPAMKQTAMQLTPTHTLYSFSNNAVQIDLAFFTPAFLDDLEVLSRPVTYLTWTAHALDGGDHQVEIYFGARSDIATSYEGQQVVFSRNQTATTTVLSVGTRDQAVLNRSGDDLRIDWGYFHVAIPKSEASKSAISDEPEQTFAQEGTMSEADDMDGSVAAGRHASQIGVVLPFGSVGAQPVSRHLLVSYTEGYAIQFLHQNLRPYWQRNNKPVATMLDEAEKQYAGLEARGKAFDKELTDDLTRTGGEHYAWICTLAYRQAIAAHKLAADASGTPMLFGKENFSNGSISTVDVLYPSAPLFLLLNPKLLEAQLLPVLQYAAMPERWKFPFAPHDLGVYPLANGQLYGGGEKTEENQMPVEESGNMIILVDALARMEGSTTLALRFWPQLTQWAKYLSVHGLDPETQLTTDDFAGHVAHNANLSIKAIDALEAYSNLANLLHHDADGKRYSAIAHDYASKWITMAGEGDHYKLAFNSSGTWSQKYNLVWDKVLDYNLFPKSMRDAEVAFYKTKLNTYGLPLDSRADYTKLDWELWTATLADNSADFNALVDPIYRWTNETVSRVPLTDFYDTKTGKQVGFQARSVVGGVFIKALADKTLREKWHPSGLGQMSGRTTTGLLSPVVRD
jgi:hypothetical protein